MYNWLQQTGTLELTCCEGIRPKSRSRAGEDTSIPKRLVMTSSRRWVSVEEAAAYLGVGDRTIRRWCNEGRLPQYRVGPRLVRLNIDDLDHYVEDSVKHHTHARLAATSGARNGMR